MKIGIIVEPYEEKNASGIAHYIMIVARELPNVLVNNEFILYTHKPFLGVGRGSRIQNILVPKSFFGKNVWFLWHSLFGRSKMPDVLMFNMPLLPLVLPSSLKTVAIFHEVTTEVLSSIPLWRRLRNTIMHFLIYMAVHRADFILSPSRATLDDLRSLYGPDEKKCLLNYNGFRKPEVAEDKVASYSAKYATPFFMYVGRVKYKKNVHMMVRGFIEFRKNSDFPHTFLIVGKSGGEYKEEILKELASAGLEKDVDFLGYVDDSELAFLYQHTTALLFVTLREGFGMPIVEAMHFGAPVITSDVSALREIAGDAALLVDPLNPSAIGEAMRSVVGNPDLRRKMIQSGTMRAKNFSWEAHFRTIAEVVQRLA